MSRRLHVPLDEAELRAAREAAAPRGDLHEKVRAIRAAAGCSFPTPDIDEMLGEIERGYLARTPE